MSIHYTRWRTKAPQTSHLANDEDKHQGTIAAFNLTSYPLASLKIPAVSRELEPSFCDVAQIWAVLNTLVTLTLHNAKGPGKAYMS